MGKFLRVLVVLICLLTAASLALACMLFIKREILKGRTQKLEEGLIQIARTIEAEPPAVPEEPATYPARDVSDCNEEILENPTRSEFWNDYKTELESLDQEIVDLKTRTRDLMSYYRINKATNKPERHPVTNLKISTGEGTTQGIIDEVLEKAKAQYDLLTETRQLLTETRIELVDTINELNGRKVTLREKLVKIVELNNTIDQLNNTIAGLQAEISSLRDQIAGLEADIENLQQEKRVLQEEKEGLILKSEELAKIIQDLRGQLAKFNNVNNPDGGPGNGDGGTIRTRRVDIAPGIKGSISRVDQKNQFVVMDLDPGFIEELLSVLTDGRLPLIELYVKRGEDQFVTKLRLKQLKKADNLAIGDILIDWQQVPIEVGDKVFYQ